MPETAGYQLVYDLPIDTNPAYGSSAVPYSVNNAASIPDSSFSRIGYYLQLQSSTPGSTPQWVYASFDANGFSRSASLLGVPTAASNEFFQQVVANMHVASNVPGIVTGNNVGTGNVEFWSTNYAPNNSAGVPGASDTLYDYGDQPTPGSYGSMQIHNYTQQQTLLAFNHFNDGATADIGIGNNPNGLSAGQNPDWTFAGNAGTYSVKDLEVVVGGPALPPLPPALRIMPLGDSITYGVPVAGGYRLPLQTDLQAAGINPLFVGSQNGNSAIGLNSPNHEGYPGYTIDQIQNLPGGIASHIAKYQPDVTLLHIGTNDISQGRTLSQMQSDLDTLISTIEGVTLLDGKHTTLIVAEIIPRADGLNAMTQQYDSLVAQLVAQHHAAGQPVFLADLFDPLNPNTDLSDVVHPNSAGYQKMAAAWASHHRGGAGAFQRAADGCWGSRLGFVRTSAICLPRQKQHRPRSLLIGAGVLRLADTPSLSAGQE